MKSKENNMDTKKDIVAGRRGFICILSGLLSGLLLASPTRLQAKKTQVKNLVGSLEMELLEKSKPTRHPSISWNTYGDRTGLYRESKGKTRAICTMNQVGKTIWEACNGKNALRDISRRVHQQYRVSSHQAYADCLTFLAQLKTVGAIQL